MTGVETEEWSAAAGGVSEPWFQRAVPFGTFLIVTAAIGWLASFILAVDKVKKLENPDAVLSCDFNPFFSCSNVMEYPQSQLFGFPNQFIGVAAFIFPLLIGVLLVSGHQLQQWIMVGLNIGALGGLALVIYLMNASLNQIGVGCPWCMVVWAMTIPTFVTVTARNALSGAFGARIRDNGVVQAVGSMPAVVSGFLLFLVLVLVLIAFNSFFLSLIGL